jgi:hypothetical protein
MSFVFSPCDIPLCSHLVMSFVPHLVIFFSLHSSGSVLRYIRDRENVVILILLVTLIKHTAST